MGSGKNQHKESIIQKSITDYLTMIQRQHKIYWFRAGSGAIKTEQGGYFKSGRPGVPDIIVVKNGLFYGLEVKTIKGKQTEHQKNAQAEIEVAGGKYFVVRSIDDVKECLGLSV